MKNTKKFLAWLLTFSIVLTMFCSVTFSVSADAKENWVIADFSKLGGADNWRSNYGNTNSDYNYYFESKIESVVTRAGKNFSLTWDGHCVKDSSNKFNTLLQSPTFQNTNGVGKLLSYENIGAWIYSDVANNGIFYFDMTDGVTGTRIREQFSLNWSGWKFVTVDLTKYTLSSFDKSDGTKAATSTDKWNLYLRTSAGSSNSATAGTLLYVDSIFCYDDPIETTELTQIGKYGMGYNSSDRTTWIKGNGADWRPAADAAGYKGHAYSLTIDTAQTGGNKNNSLSNRIVNDQSSPYLTFTENVINNGYINLVMKQDKTTENLTFSVCLTKNNKPSAGYAFKNTGFSLTGTDWQIVSVKFTDLVNTKSGGAALSSSTEIANIGIYVPDVATWYSNANSIIYNYTTKFIIDSIWISDYDMSKTPVGTTITDGSVISSTTDNIGFTFPKDLDLNKGVFDSAISVKKGEDTVDPETYTVQQEGNALYVRFDEGLAPSSTYTITYAGGDPGEYMQCEAKTLTFTTAAPHYGVAYKYTGPKDIELGADAIPGQNIKTKIYATFENASADDVNASLIVALMNENNEIVKFEIAEPVTVNAGKTKILKNSITPEHYTSNTLKVFVWDMNTFQPYVESDARAFVSQ